MKAIQALGRYRALRLLALSLIWAAHGPAQAQVKYFDHVPSAEEIDAALRPTRKSDDAGATVGPQGKTRGISWTSDSSPIAAATQAVATGAALAFQINFETGLAKVPRASLPYIEAMASSLLRNPNMRLLVEGHTDVAGNAKANLMLSWERAFSVFKVLVDRYGIDPARLQPLGKGAAEPITPDDPFNGMNRRVQFRLLGGA